jgi:hypothetical protein
MTVQLALYKGKGQIGNALIRWWTGSIYSHCELVVDGWCYSSSIMDKGVRRKQIDLDSGNWELVDLPWAYRSDVLSYFKATDSDTYGWLPLLGSQILNRNQAQEGSQFCSQWCAKALGLPIAASLNPAMLKDVGVWVNLVVLPSLIRGGYGCGSTSTG